MYDLSDVSVVLPSLDPDEKLSAVIEGLIAKGFRDIILVDDGSSPENQHYFQEAASLPQIHLLRHETNRGKGAALKTAFHWFLEHRPSAAGVVTVDGDNQHHPEDIAACVGRMLQSGHIVLGVRDFSLPQVPARSRFGNRVTSGVFKIFCGMRVSDTQTGLRAIPRSALPALSAVGGDRFEYETNMLLAIKDNSLPFEEVKCQTIYLEKNKSSHFRVFRDSWRIYRLLFAHFFRYTLSSLFCAAVDEGLFTLLSWLLRNALSGIALTAAPILAARLASSLLNFILNKRLVFQSQASAGKALVRYYALAVPLLLLQLLLTHGTFLLFGIGAERTGLRTLIHAAVMTALFLASFVIQKRWVFQSQRRSVENER